MRLVQENPFFFETVCGGGVSLDTLPAGTRIALFGAGGRGSEVLACLKRHYPGLDPVFFIDNFKAGARDGLCVHFFADVMENRRESFDRVLVASCCSQAMVEQLGNVGIDDPIVATLGSQGGLLERMHELYPAPTACFIESIEGLEGGSVRIVLASPEGPAECVWRINDGPNRESPVGEILLPGPLAERAVVRGAMGTHLFSFVVAPCPVEGIEAGSLEQSYWFEPGEMRVMPKSHIDFGPYSLPQADAEYARRRWGRLVDGADDDYAAAKSIALSIVDDLRGVERGRPDMADVMSSTPIAFYQKMCDGRQPFRCGHIAAAFRDACRALGIMCRFVSVGRTELLGRARFYLSEGHAVNEVFCRTRNQWIFMDLTGEVLGVGLGEDVLLNFLEFHSFLHSGRRKSLKGLCVGKDGMTELQPIERCFPPKVIHSRYHQDKHCVFTMA